MFSPFSFEENISSFETVENLASAGAAPTVLASSANTGLASKASDAVINAIFFISSSSAELLLFNAALQRMFRLKKLEHLRRGAMRLFVEPRQQRLRGILRIQRRERD